MPTTVSYTTFDHEAVCIVPVIASFDVRGRICPLYLRIDGVNYKVDTYVRKEHYAHITEFACQIRQVSSVTPARTSPNADTGLLSEESRLHPLSLTYHANESMWTIPARQPAAPIP